MTLPLFSDDINRYLTSRPGWISRRSWDRDLVHDEWIWGPHIGIWIHPNTIELDGYGIVCWGASERRYRDAIYSHRIRLFTLDDLVSTITMIEEWSIPDDW